MASARDDVAAKVFNAEELRELIILVLPTQDILNVRRLSKSVRNTIDGSLWIQRNLFLDDSGPTWENTHPKNGHVRAHHLMTTRPHLAMPDGQCMFNPALFTAFASVEINRKSANPPYFFVRWHLRRDTTVREHLGSATPATWEKMCATQPRKTLVAVKTGGARRDHALSDQDSLRCNTSTKRQHGLLS